MGRNAKRARYVPPPNPAAGPTQDQADGGEPEVCTRPAGFKRTAGGTQGALASSPPPGCMQAALGDSIQAEAEVAAHAEDAGGAPNRREGMADVARR